MTLHSVPKCSACVHYRDTTIRGFPQSLCSMYKQTQLLKANKSKYFHRILYYKALLEGRYEGLDLAFFWSLLSWQEGNLEEIWASVRGVVVKWGGVRAPFELLSTVDLNLQAEERVSSPLSAVLRLPNWPESGCPSRCRPGQLSYRSAHHHRKSLSLVFMRTLVFTFELRYHRYLAEFKNFDKAWMIWDFTVG